MATTAKSFVGLNFSFDKIHGLRFEGLNFGCFPMCETTTCASGDSCFDIPYWKNEPY